MFFHPHAAYNTMALRWTYDFVLGEGSNIHPGSKSDGEVEEILS